MPNFLSPAKLILVGILSALVLMGGSYSTLGASAGYWRYVRTEVTPSQSVLDETSRASGGTTELRVGGATQLEYTGMSTLELYFKTQDANGEQYLSQVTFYFGTGVQSDLSMLRPGQVWAFRGRITIKSNYPGASATGNMAVNNGDYFLATAGVVGKDGTSSGSFVVPSGSANDNMLRVYANANLSAYGGFSETLTNFYEWIGGPLSPPDQTEPAPAQSSDFGGQWSTSEGDVVLSQSGDTVSGTYTQDNGRISGEVRSDHLIGYWGEDSSGQRCDTERLGTFFWGRIDWTLAADGKSFTGAYSYCDDDPNSPWTGRRD